MMRFSVKWLGLLSLSVVLLGMGTSASAFPAKFKVYAVEVSGVKFWLPSNIVVKKGQKVIIQAQSKLEGPNPVHGFQIPAYKISEVVGKEAKKIEFKATQKGVFPINCHLHPAHVGGQLIVQ